MAIPRLYSIYLGVVELDIAPKRWEFSADTAKDTFAFVFDACSWCQYVTDIKIGIGGIRVWVAVSTDNVRKLDEQLDVVRACMNHCPGIWIQNEEAA